MSARILHLSKTQAHHRPVVLKRASRRTTDDGTAVVPQLTSSHIEGNFGVAPRINPLNEKLLVSFLGLNAYSVFVVLTIVLTAILVATCRYIFPFFRTVVSIPDAWYAIMVGYGFNLPYIFFVPIFGSLLGPLNGSSVVFFAVIIVLISLLFQWYGTMMSILISRSILGIGVAAFKVPSSMIFSQFFGSINNPIIFSLVTSCGNIAILLSESITTSMKHVPNSWQTWIIGFIIAGAILLLPLWFMPSIAFWLRPAVYPDAVGSAPAANNQPVEEKQTLTICKALSGLPSSLKVAYMTVIHMDSFFFFVFSAAFHTLGYGVASSYLPKLIVSLMPPQEKQVLGFGHITGIGLLIGMMFQSSCNIFAKMRLGDQLSEFMVFVGMVTSTIALIPIVLLRFVVDLEKIIESGKLFVYFFAYYCFSEVYSGTLESACSLGLTDRELKSSIAGFFIAFSLTASSAGPELYSMAIDKMNLLGLEGNASKYAQLRLTLSFIIVSYFFSNVLMAIGIRLRRGDQEKFNNEHKEIQLSNIVINTSQFQSPVFATIEADDTTKIEVVKKMSKIRIFLNVLIAVGLVALMVTSLTFSVRRVFAVKPIDAVKQ